MMVNLLKRGETLARGMQERKLRDVAELLRGIFGSAAIEVEAARVLVRGTGIIKRWLIDPNLRFLAGGLK